MFCIRNFEAGRWPMGNPETGYLNSDGGPTKSEVLSLRRNGEDPSFWQLCHAKRDSVELEDLRKDPDCLNNLAGDPDSAPQVAQLKQQLFAGLRARDDPRMFGNGDVFDRYLYGRGACPDEPNRNYYNRFASSEIDYKPTWVSSSDFEEALIPEASG